MILKKGFVCPRFVHALNNAVKVEKDEILTLNRNKTNLIYTKDGINLKLPRFSRPRRRFLRILEKTSSVDYLPVESLLERVKDKCTFSNFSNIERTFLQIVKWIFFRRKEIINHDLFPELRSETLKNSSLFGAVYCRFLKNILKSSRLYGGYGIRNGLKFYIKLRDGNFLENLSLPNIAEFGIDLTKIPNSFYSRILNLCRNSNRLEVLKSVFKNSKIRPRSSILDFHMKGNEFVESNWGYFCYYAIKNLNKSVVQAIIEICRPKETGNFDYLKTGESDLDFANRHFGTVLNLFSQVYKIFNLTNSENSAVARDKDGLLDKLGIYLAKDYTTDQELRSIYYRSKFKLLVLGKLEDHVVAFIEVVDYLNKCLQSKDCNYDYLNRFIQCICRPYMERIKGYFGHINGNLNTIFNETFTASKPGYNLLVTSPSIATFRNYGLEHFSNIFQKDSERACEDRIYGIMKDEESSFLYDFIDSRAVTSSNIDSMDHKNLKGSCFDTVNYCHLIMFSKSEDVNGLVDKNVNFLREKFSKLNDIDVDTHITLDLPNYNKNEAQEFDRRRLKCREIIKHPVNSQLYITLNYWPK